MHLLYALFSLDTFLSFLQRKMRRADFSLPVPSPAGADLPSFSAELGRSLKNGFTKKHQVSKNKKISVNSERTDEEKAVNESGK